MNDPYSEIHDVQYETCRTLDEDLKDITSIVISDSAVGIDEMAFNGFKYLESINISDSVLAPPSLKEIN